MDLSRRRLLQGAAAAGAATALPISAASAAGAAVTRKSAPALSRGSAFFLNKGLVHGAWCTTDTTGRFYPSWQMMSGAGFTMPVYYEEPLYNATQMAQTSGGMWGLAKAPDANQITSGPTPGEQLLSPLQQSDLARLGTVCFGDEESYSTALVSWLQQYYAAMRASYPGAMCHNNQYPGQWSTAQLQNYTAVAQPDLLTFDSYYFSDGDSYAGNSVTPLYNALAQYRAIALAGHDGTGAAPIPFGQYTLGYRTGSAAYLAGDYTISESQLQLVSNVVWTMGGKWLCLFRWEGYDATDSPWALLNNPDGSTTRVYSQYANLNAKMATLSPHLTRLTSTGVWLRRGPASPAAAVPDWSAGTVPYLTAVAVTNTGTTNGGQPGDVLFGTFATLPGLTTAQLGPVPSLSTRYFMLCNALMAPMDAPDDMNSTGGTGAETKQQITLTFDLGTRDPASLRFVNQHTGTVTAVALTSIGGTKYRLVWNLEGGTSELFYWA